MGTLISKTHDKLYRDTIKQVRTDIGRKVKIYLPGNKRRCSNCLFSPVDGKSSGIYRPDSPYPTAEMPGPTPFTHGLCPVCRGSGFYASRLTVKEVLCHVRPLTPDERKWTPVGQLIDADYRLQTDPQFLNDFKRALKIEVDGQETELVKVYTRGLKGIAQILVYVKFSPLNTPGNKNRTVHGGPL